MNFQIKYQKVLKWENENFVSELYISSIEELYPRLTIPEWQHLVKEPWINDLQCGSTI